MSETELLIRARRGDRAAFAELCAPYERRAFNLAVRLCGDRSFAVDLCHEALLRLYASLGAPRGGGSFGVRLFRYVHDVCLDALRQRGAATQAAPPAALPLDRDRQPAAGDDPDWRPGDDPRRERRALLLAALECLNVDLRAAVVLRDVCGFSEEEAAAIGGVPRGTLRLRLDRARVDLREQLRASSVFQEVGGGKSL